MDIGVLTTNTVSRNLRASFDSTDRGDRDAVVAAIPDMEKWYPHLIKVPVPLEDIYVTLYVRKDAAAAYTVGNHENLSKTALSKTALSKTTLTNTTLSNTTLSKATLSNTTLSETTLSYADLSGLRVGMLTGRAGLLTQMPSDATIVDYEMFQDLTEGLANGEIDVILYGTRLHEQLNLPEDCVSIGVIDIVPEYLYLHESKACLLPDITRSLTQIYADGRGEKFLSNEPMPELYTKKTVLHILSGNSEVPREALFGETLRALTDGDASVEWVTLALNTRLFSDERTRLNYFAYLLRQDSVSRHIAAIVVSGEEALSFVKEHYHVLFMNIPVLFYGIGKDPATLVKGYEPYITGVSEWIEAEETIKLALSLFPDTRHIFVVNDFTAEGWYYRNVVAQQLAGYESRYTIAYNTDVSLETLSDRLAALPPDSLVFVGSYCKDATGRYYALNDMKTLLAQVCAVPIVSVYSTRPEYNAVGGKCLDYEKYAELLSGMLNRVLLGEKPADLPIVTDTTQCNRWVFDKVQLDVWKLTTAMLPRDALIVNRELALWETNPQFVISMWIIMGVFVVIIIVSLRSQHHLQQKHAALKEAQRNLHTAEEMREVKERLEQIINTAPVSYMLLVNGIATEINKRMSHDIGLALGADTRGIYADPGQYARLMEGLARNGAITREIVPIYVRDGSIHRYMVSISVTEYNHRSAAIVWAFDMEAEEAQREQLAVMHRSMRTVLDSLPVPVRVTDLENKRILYMNRQCLDMFGIDTLEAACRLHIMDLLPACQSNGEDSWVLADRILYAEGVIAAEAENKALDGRIIDAYVVSCKILFNNRFASVGIIKDLAEEKAYKQMLLTTAEKEKEANQLKSRFLVNMSHEIRTPMNAIIGLTDIELYKREAGPALEVFEKINISARSLLQIMNDILDLSKIEADKIELTYEEFVLAEVFAGAMLVATPRLEGKDVEMLLNMSLDLPYYVVGDKTRLWQILKNFLDNSAKFTEHGRIWLTVYAAQTDNTAHTDNTDNTLSVTFVIEDTGIGIHGEMIDEIFQPYQQINNEAQKQYAGTGLGMPIAKQLCEKMGGRLQIDSQAGKGTTITMTIPFKRSANRETTRQIMQVPSLTGKRILVVDHDEKVCGVINDILSCNDIRCVTTENGEKAWALIDGSSKKAEALINGSGKNTPVFDVVLLDYVPEHYVPEHKDTETMTANNENSLDIAKRIHRKMPDTPMLLMVTAYEKRLLQHELDAAGIGAVLEKPFTPTQLMYKLGKLLGFAADEHRPESFMQFENTRVLLCEDNVINQEVALGMLAQFGIQAVVAENGRQALEKMDDAPFDMILMDLYMPIVDGFEATRRIRAIPRFAKIPIVSLTADAMPEVITRCRAVGMNDHIEKPIVFDRLEHILLTWLPEQKRIGRIPRKAPSAATMAKIEIPAQFAGDKRAYEKNLRSFFDSLPTVWPDYRQTKYLVHDIKGVSGNLGLQDIYRCAVEYEKTLRVGAPNEALYDAMVSAITQCRAGLLPSFAMTEPGSLDELRTLTAQMAQALDACDPIAGTDIADTLSQKTWPEEVSADIKQLCYLTNEYAFFEASDVLNRIIHLITSRETI